MHFVVNTRLLVPDKMDGIGRFTYETLSRLSKSHPEIQFTFVFDRKLKEGDFTFPDNVTTFSLLPQARHPILWIIWFEFLLKKYINRHSFDLFISPEGWVPPKLKCKSLSVVHDLNFEHHPENIIKSHLTYLKHFFPRFVKRADRIATVSAYSKKDIVDTYSINPNKVDIVYNGVTQVFQPITEEEKSAIRLNYAKGEEYFIFIGTIHPRKNLEHLFKAFSIFKQNTSSKIKLLIVGNRKWWPSRLEKVYQSTFAKQDIHFLGRLEDNELAKVLGAALCLTYLPYFEGFGIPILEAFQAEVPVITSNVTSMPEVAGQAAKLCDPHNETAIADAMEELFKDDNKRRQMIEAGKEQLKAFSWNNTSELLWSSIQKSL